jgi:copper oxidase (laccase) domain-containing protein
MHVPSFGYTHGALDVRVFDSALSFNYADCNQEVVQKEIYDLIQSSEYIPQKRNHVIWQWPGISSLGYPLRNAIALDEIYGAPQATALKTNTPADGIVVFDHRITVAMTSRDCPYLILYVKDPEVALIMHCGRDQLHNTGGRNPKESVISDTLALIGNRFDPCEVYGCITRGIAPEHFTNDRYPGIIATLTRYWGDDVVPDRERCTLDLKEIILRQLETYRIPRANITIDTVDTFSNPASASVRAGRSDAHNLILVSC